jgi:hypothetical protein
MPALQRDAQATVDQYIDLGTVITAMVIEYAGEDQENPIASANIRRLRASAGAVLAALDRAGLGRAPAAPPPLPPPDQPIETAPQQARPATTTRPR